MMRADCARAMNGVRSILLVALLAIMIGSVARADLVSPYGGETAPNFVEIHVLADRARVVLEIDRADYPFFVTPDDGVRRSLAERTGGTLAVDVDGVRPRPEIRIVDVRARKARPSAAAPVAAPRRRSADVVYAVLDFRFEGRPRTLTFTPPLDASGRPSAAIGLLVTHLGVPVTDYRYLSQPERMLLDWDDPWFTAFENPNLTRHHRSPLMSFIAIDAREVRHEILFRLRDLEAWTELDFGNTPTLDASAIAEVRRAAAEFFAHRNPLLIDGVERLPDSAQVSVVEVDATGLQVVEDPQSLNRVTALFGVVLSYPHATMPREVRMTWDLFPEGVATIPTVVTDPAGGMPSSITDEDRRVVWTNFLRDWVEPATVPVSVAARPTVGVPILSAVLFILGGVAAVAAFRSSSRRRWTALALVAVAASLATTRIGVLPVAMPGVQPEPQAVAAIVDAMVRNAATATLETSSAGFDAALVRFVRDADIPTVGAEMRRGLAVRLPSGAVARTDAIQSVTVEEITPREKGVRVLATWTAQVSGGHWGHLHRRTLRYRAFLDVEEVRGIWMLEGLTVLSARMET